MDEAWRSLRAGDRVKIVRLPSNLVNKPNFVDEEEANFYRHLIAEGGTLAIDRIDEWDKPWVEYTEITVDGNEHYHSLALNDDSWERV